MTSSPYLHVFLHTTGASYLHKGGRYACVSEGEAQPSESRPRLKQMQVQILSLLHPASVTKGKSSKPEKPVSSPLETS